MSAKELVDRLTKGFDVDILSEYFKVACSKFRPDQQDLSEFIPEDQTQFNDISKIGEVEYDDANRLVFAVCQVDKDLSDRDSKKTQYELGKKILKQHYYDAGIFVFYGVNNSFRLSLIVASYQGTKREFTTFKRYTYFVSDELTNKTFIKQFGGCDFSSIDNILEAFSIEAVNKDFYTQIARKFTDLVGGWLKIGGSKYERDGSLVWPDSNDEKRKEFAVRLIGRLVFCWFLKKKHSEPANIPLIPKDILSLETANNNDGYYRFMLEPLFFQVLNKKLNDRHKKYKTNGWDKIPFLNGGLFTPHNDDYYDPDFQGISPRGDVKVSDEWLRELLEIFERYNFTIDENTPVDIEISIDPEMLGRIFENLLAMINPETGETARKSTGSYYTPRPIVEYMVDQSIKQYLLTQTKVPEKKIDSLLSYSDEAENASLTGKQSDCVIEALDKLKVLDPACGSGAFPIGVLQKILLVLEKVDPDSKKWKTRLLAKIPNTTARKALAEKLESETWQYIHKLGVIQSSIYGVDIQPIAAEISKLRIFLSLIVDESVNDDKYNRGIEPLPNLKYKFVCGNSLIDKFMGRIIKTDTSVQTADKKIIDKLTGLKADFFSAISEEEKVEYNLKILQSKIELARQLLTDLKDKNKFTGNLFGDEAHTKKEKKEKKEAIIKQAQVESLNKAIENAIIDINKLLTKSKIELTEVEQLETMHFKDSFIWEMDFAEIFAENNGFDIVIGNPPYISHDKIKKTEKDYFKKTYRSYDPFADIYCFFIEKAMRLQNSNGTLSFITSNSFLRADYGGPIRNSISENNYILRAVNIDTSQIFESAIVNVVILISTKNKAPNNTCWVVDASIPDGKHDFNSFVTSSGYTYEQSAFKSKFWGLSRPEVLTLLKKLEIAGETLENLGAKIRLGLATGYNDAFIIDELTRQSLIAEDKNNAKIINPVLRGRDIFRYKYNTPDSYILLTKNGVDVEKDYPSIYRHFESFGNRFKTRGAKGQHWTNLRACAFFDDFKEDKIVWIELTDEGRFALCKEELYLLNSAYFMLPPSQLSSKYLLAILNSSAIHFYLRHNAETSGMGTTRWINNYVKEFPIPSSTKSEQDVFINEVEKIIAIKATTGREISEDKLKEVKLIERRIDQMVYKLYGLSEAEIAIIEGQDRSLD